MVVVINFVEIIVMELGGVHVHPVRLRKIGRVIITLSRIHLYVCVHVRKCTIIL